MAIWAPTKFPVEESTYILSKNEFVSLREANGLMPVYSCLEPFALPPTVSVHDSGVVDGFSAHTTCSEATVLVHFDAGLIAFISVSHQNKLPWPKTKPAGSARLRRTPQGFPAKRSPRGRAQLRIAGFRGGVR